MSSNLAASAYCFLSFRHFFSILISWPKHSHVSDVKLAGASSISKTFVLSRHLRRPQVARSFTTGFTTGFVEASGMQRLMSVHGSMVTALLHCGWKRDFFFPGDLLFEKMSTVTLWRFCRRGTAKLTNTVTSLQDSPVISSLCHPDLWPQ